ncbi:MBL fold metallo-hydrolase [Lysobacter sp. HA18]
MRPLLLALGIALSTASVAAFAAGPSPVKPGERTIAVGALKLTSLRDAQFNAPNDGKVFGVDVGAAPVTKFLAARNLPTDVIPLSVDALLVRGIPGHVVLLDTGVGPRAGGVLLKSLAQAGVSPSQITDVLITHSHSDHVGGLVNSDGKSAFPRASIRMTDAEWTWFKGQVDNKPLVDAIASQVKTYAPGDTVVPDIVSVPFKGHTPGHVGYRIGSGRSSVLDIGDTAHSSAVSLGHPEWTMGFDSDPVVGRQTRATELGVLAKDHTLIFSPHFPYPGTGRVVRTQDSYSWVPYSP